MRISTGQTRREREAQRKRQVWANYRAGMIDRLRTDAVLDRAERHEQRDAIRRGDADPWDGFSTWPHLLATLLTGGLWLPVLIWVLIRNDRRQKRTPWGQAAAERRYNAMQEVKSRQRTRERELAKQRWRDLGDDMRRLTGRRGA